MIYSAVKKYASESDIYNFGCSGKDEYIYSYIEISVLIGLLLASKAVDFVVTGCSSGQGMMLACNCLPGVLCGYVPTPKDAYLFVQINNGNAISLPLVEDYTWSGADNLDKTIEREPTGDGELWPFYCPFWLILTLLKDIHSVTILRSPARSYFENTIGGTVTGLIISVPSGFAPTGRWDLN